MKSSYFKLFEFVMILALSQFLWGQPLCSYKMDCNTPNAQCLYANTTVQSTTKSHN